jgi:hypothetical protein
MLEYIVWTSTYKFEILLPSFDIGLFQLVNMIFINTVNKYLPHSTDVDVMSGTCSWIYIYMCIHCLTQLNEFNSHQ